jgi:N-acetylmuramoyl-L-alanine amidase
MMRKIDEIIIHCSATKSNYNLTKNLLRQWHIEENGWSDIGYHFFIDLDGVIHTCRPIEKKGAHTRGHNENSIGVCYAGGISDDLAWKDTRNDLQKKSLKVLIDYLKLSFPTINNISGHNEYSDKECPSFDVKKEYTINER